MDKKILSKFETIFNDFVNLISPNKIKVKKDENSEKKAPTEYLVIKKIRGKSEEAIKPKDQSKVDSQGTPKFSGSSYNGKGNVDNSKTRYNRKRR